MTDAAPAHHPGSILQARLQAGDFVVTAELTPPVATEAPMLIERARQLKGLATAINITDGAGAKTHLSSLVAAHLVLQAGVEPILQMTCRDRNRLALQADLLGAMALGIHNILALGGDDPKGGDQPDTKPVFDLDSRALLAIAHRMRSERTLPSGHEIKGPVDLVLGATDVPIDPPPGWEPKGLMSKAAAGADFAQTQFCMDAGIARRYAQRLLELGIAPRVAVLIGVAPIPSVRSARWMREKLFGTIIPEGIVTRLEGAGDPAREGRAICVELMQEFAEIPGIAGVHVMAPQNPSAIPEVIAASGVTTRKRAGAR
ncbi:MAG TPA: methylenetetrahydrofolate reductase [Stellaceae bacterium]|nr:methylenetetrahydrofolate reductase [Stellaceae bacterium]